MSHAPLPRSSRRNTRLGLPTRQSAFDADIGGTSYRLQLFLYDIDGMDELDPCVAFVRYLDHGAVGGYFCSTVTTHGVLAGALDKGIL
ncbi:MAG: hypothetical protein ACKVGZ_12720 [Alphaproteobacteria bacterium]|jgi:hypothetical protein